MSATDDLHAAALAYAAEQGWSKPVTPPPPPAAPPWDGRATLSPLPFPKTSGMAPAAVTTTPPLPYGLWDGYTYQGSDVSVGVDGLYHVAPAAGHHSPYNAQAPVSTTFAEITKRRDTGLGQTFYWSESITLLSSDVPDWGSFVSLGYQTILYDQLALGIGGTGTSGTQWSIHITSGLVANGKPQFQTFAALKPVTLGQRTDWIIGAHIAADSTGWVEVHYRPEGGTWSQPYSKTGIPTVEWTQTDASGKPVVGGTCLDKEGLYFGWWNATRTPAPTGIVTLRGLVRDVTLADALTRFPA